MSLKISTVTMCRIACDGGLTECPVSSFELPDLAKLIMWLRHQGWFIDDKSPELTAYCPEHKDRAVLARKPKTPEVRALQNASTDVLIARVKELDPDGRDNELVNLTCVMDPASRRRRLIAMILEAELMRSELDNLWDSVCGPAVPADRRPFTSSGLIRQILDAELPAPGGT